MLQAITGLSAGAVIGFFVGKYMSRLGMGCPLLCNPKISTIYFAVLGLLYATGQ